MGLNISQGDQILVSTLVPTDTVVVNHGLGGAPKVIMIMPKGHASFNPDNGDALWSFGGWAGSDNITGFATQDQDDVATTNTKRFNSDADSMFILNDNTGGLRIRGSIGSVNSTSFTLTINAGSLGRDEGFHWFALSGSDIEKVKVGNHKILRATAGTEEVRWTDDFAPDFVLIASSLQETLGSQNGDMHVSLGMTDFTNEYCIATASGDNDTASNTDRINHASFDDRILVKLNSDGGVPLDVTMEAVQPAEGFDLDVIDPDTTQRNFMYIAIKGNIQIKVDTFNHLTANGDITSQQSSVGFKPKGIFGFTDGRTAFNVSLNYHPSMGVQTVVGDKNGLTTYMSGDDGASNTDNRQGASDSFIKVVNKDNSGLNEVYVKEWLDEGFTLTQINSSGALATQTFYAVFGESDLEEVNLEGNFNRHFLGGFLT
jgi:hypothetical protein